MNGYYQLPHDYKQDILAKAKHKKNWDEFEVFLYILDDIYHKNKVSYKLYCKIFGWTFRKVKRYLLHLGLKINTLQCQNKLGELIPTNPIPNKSFSKSVIGYGKSFIEKLTPEGTPEEHQKKTTKKQQKQIFSDKETPPLAPELHQKEQINNCINNSKRSRRSKNKKINNNIIPQEFEKLFQEYEKVNQILKEHTKRACARSNIKYCWEIYQKKLSKYSIEEINKAIFNYLAEILINTKQSIPMLSSLLNGFEKGRYDIDYYLSIENGQLRKKAKKYLEWLVGNKKENSKEDLQNMQKFINSGLMPLD